MPLAVEQIVDRVNALRTSIHEERGDEETWHGEEDAIMSDALQAIANGAPNPRQIAQEALKPNELEFARWYA